jgi:hypothetical protein
MTFVSGCYMGGHGLLCSWPIQAVVTMKKVNIQTDTHILYCFVRIYSILNNLSCKCYKYECVECDLQMVDVILLIVVPNLYV